MITVEDFNSVLQEYGSSNIYHCIDTSLISEDYDYDGIKYDFCEVDRETTDTDEYTFKFKVVNGAWTGGYYLLNSDDEYVDDATASYDSSTGVITIVTDNPSIKLQLYLCNIAFEFDFKKMYWKIKNPHTLTKMSTGNDTGLLEDSDLVILFDLLYGTGENYIHILKEGDPSETNAPLYYAEEYGYGCDDYVIVSHVDRYESFSVRVRLGNTLLYIPVNQLYHDPLLITLSPLSVKTGKVNSIQIPPNSIGKDEEYIAYYDGKEITVNKTPIGVGNYYHSFDLDLRDKTDLSPVKLQIKSFGEHYYFNHTYDFVLDCSYLVINTVSDLVTECGTNGASVFKLGADLTLTSDVTVAHDVNIIGDGCTIDLDGHSIIVSDGVKFELSDCMLSNGDNAIVQKADSEVVCSGVTFRNCVSSEYSNLGSCIYCDIDLDSLDVEDDFKTTLNDCSFFDNQSAILSGGTLVLDGCKLHNTDLNYIDKHNVALLYQSDGAATIRNGIFDIDYTDESLCTNQESIGFAQCLFRLGETARINGHTYTDIRDNGIEITSNACHIFAKYYYPSLEECVFTSPVLDKEDSAFCYALTGLNKIFKHNVQITKASDNAENTYRKIEW